MFCGKGNSTIMISIIKEIFTNQKSVKTSEYPQNLRNITLSLLLQIVWKHPLFLESGYATATRFEKFYWGSALHGSGVGGDSFDFIDCWE